MELNRPRQVGVVGVSAAEDRDVANAFGVLVGRILVFKLADEDFGKSAVARDEGDQHAEQEQSAAEFAAIGFPEQQRSGGE